MFQHPHIDPTSETLQKTANHTCPAGAIKNIVVLLSTMAKHSDKMLADTHTPSCWTQQQVEHIFVLTWNVTRLLPAHTCIPAPTCRLRYVPAPFSTYILTCFLGNVPKYLSTLILAAFLHIFNMFSNLTLPLVLTVWPLISQIMWRTFHPDMYFRFLWHLFMYHAMSLTWDIMWHLIWQRPCNLQFFCHMVDVNNQLRLLLWDVFSHLAWHLSWQIFSHPVWHSDISGSLHQCTEANKVKNESTKEQNRNNWRRASGGGRSGPKEHRDNFVLAVFPFCRCGCSGCSCCVFCFSCFCCSCFSLLLLLFALLALS